MNRLALPTAALVAAMLMGCSSPSDTGSTTQEDTDSTESAITLCGDYDLDVEVACETGSKQAYTLLSFNGETLTGVNGFGQTITANFTSSTNFKKANLNKFTPTDPVRPALVAYNAAIQNGTGVLTLMEDLVSFQPHARVSVKNGNVKAFRPVP
ncbi:MAG: hypothetical protein JWP87_6265 [Labilithrix sp.]|nr:hypothetical protein [Labilithrix sp.]